MGSVEVTTAAALPVDQVIALRMALGLPPRGPERWRRALAASTCVASAWSDDSLVGMGRIVDDGTMAMFYDLAVHPDFQARGIALQIGHLLIDYVKDKGFVSIGLFAFPDKRLISGYERMGFTLAEGGMELTAFEGDGRDV